LSPLWGLRGNVQCSSRLTGKLVVNLLFLLIVLLSLGVTAKALRAIIFLEIGVFKGDGSVSAKFSFRLSRGRPPRTMFARIGQ